jgi:hypothetical protein
VALQVKPPHHTASAWPDARRRLLRLFAAAIYQGYQGLRIEQNPSRVIANSS